RSTRPQPRFVEDSDPGLSNICSAPGGSKVPSAIIREAPAGNTLRGRAFPGAACDGSAGACRADGGKCAGWRQGLPDPPPLRGLPGRGARRFRLLRGEKTVCCPHGVTRPHGHGRPLPRPPWMRYLTECRAFFQQFRRQYHNTGSILPSSRALARALVSRLRGRRAPARILEVGPGTGAVTDEILRQLRPGDRLDLVEINADFVALLRR